MCATKAQSPRERSSQSRRKQHEIDTYTAAKAARYEPPSQVHILLTRSTSINATIEHGYRLRASQVQCATGCARRTHTCTQEPGLSPIAPSCPFAKRHADAGTGPLFESRGFVAQPQPGHGPSMKGTIELEYRVHTEVQCSTGCARRTHMYSTTQPVIHRSKVPNWRATR